MFGVFLSAQSIGHSPLVLGRRSFAGDINLRLIERETLHFSLADKIVIALHNEVATLAEEGKTGTAHDHILSEALVQSSRHGFASLLDPCIVNSGKQIT